MKIFHLSSRLILLITVVIASFLAAFVGQIVVTNYTQGPSLVGNQGLILRPSKDPFEKLQDISNEIALQQEALVTIYGVQGKDYREVAKGVQATSDGMLIAIGMEGATLTPRYARKQGGEMVAITEVWEDENSTLMVLATDSTNDRPVTFSDTSTLASYTPYPLVSSTTNSLVFSEGVLVPKSIYVSSDMPNRYSLLSGGAVGDLVLSQKGEVMGLVSMVEEKPVLVNASSLDMKLKQVLRDGEIQSTKLGLYYIDLAQTTIEESLAFDQPKGALVTNAYIDTDSPVTSVLPSTSIAYKAGLRHGDIIQRVDGEELTKQYSFSDAMRNIEIGDTIDLEVLRAETELSIEITLE